MCKGPPSDHALAEKRARIWREDDEVCIRIAGRTVNTGRRVGCTCRDNADTCAVHILWDQFFQQLPHACEPWHEISTEEAKRRLRAVLDRLGEPDASQYTLSGFRFGSVEV